MYRVLVIDDDPSGTQLLITLLEFEGHRGYGVETWRDPLHDVEALRPDLVIMDVRLRVTDGLELLRQLRAHPDAGVAATPVLMMSAEDFSVQCQAAGADGFVEKPFRLETLMAAIQKATEVRVSNE
jgi:CheY-like chemotaxis protein